jgi:copper chaperone CopZ
METTIAGISGMTCGGCGNNVATALNKVTGVESADVDHAAGTATIFHSDEVLTSDLEAAITTAGYPVADSTTATDLDSASSTTLVPGEFNWSDGSVWKQSANNTKWCLIGCSIGEFGTLAYYSFSGITADLVMYSNLWYFFAILPLINGLATSVMLETAILMRNQMNFSNALSTAFGMSFISMLMMEIAMEVTDLLFTGGQLGMNYYAIPLMLLVGFLTPWPYNYWRLKKLGKACH